MKKILLPLTAVSLLAFSCGNQSANTDAASVPVVRKEMNSEVVKTVANLSIEGMTCSSGCGGKIQQELRALKGVTSTDLDYADNRTANTVSVEFIPGQISEQEMIMCVGGISDGSYKVKSVEIVQYKGLQGTGGGTVSDADLSTNELGKVFQLLNLLQSLTKIVE